MEPSIGELRDDYDKAVIARATTREEGRWVDRYRAWEALVGAIRRGEANKVLDEVIAHAQDEKHSASVE